jgi:hypothetical protein
VTALDGCSNEIGVLHWKEESINMLLESSVLPPKKLYKEEPLLLQRSMQGPSSIDLYGDDRLVWSVKRKRKGKHSFVDDDSFA